jgi:hypothetical protein
MKSTTIDAGYKLCVADEFNNSAFKPQNIEQGISNFEIREEPASLLRFEIHYSIFYISSISV